MQRLVFSVVSMALLSLGLVACAPDLRADYPFDGDTESGPLIKVTVNSETGLRTATINASNQSTQVYLDLDTDSELKVDEALTSNAWDLSFKRVTVASNGGSGNPNGVVSVAVLTDRDWATLTSAPESGFVQDSDVPVFNGVEGGWYNYDLTKHGVNPTAGLIYVVKTSAQNYFKLRVLNYYDAAGTSGHYSVEYQKLVGPAVTP